MYEVPVRIKNQSSSSKRITIKGPKNKYFKVDYDRKTKNTQIAPGLHLEILIIFETDNASIDYFDQIEIVSEREFVLQLKAYKQQPMIQFEPFVNLGFVPLNTKKIETIEFFNEGTVDTSIELKISDKNSDVQIDPEKFDLMRNTSEYKKRCRKKVQIIYEYQ